MTGEMDYLLHPRPRSGDLWPLPLDVLLKMPGARMESSLALEVVKNSTALPLTGGQGG
jgi:hypothetical protein